MANLPQEPGPALAHLRLMHEQEPPSGGECPACRRHNAITARRCTHCGHWFLPPRRVQLWRWIRTILHR